MRLERPPKNGRLFAGKVAGLLLAEFAIACVDPRTGANTRAVTGEVEFDDCQWPDGIEVPGTYNDGISFWQAYVSDGDGYDWSDWALFCPVLDPFPSQSAACSTPPP